MIEDLIYRALLAAVPLPAAEKVRRAAGWCQEAIPGNEDRVRHKTVPLVVQKVAA